MKKHAVCFAVALVLALVFCGSAFAAAPFHIGVATLTVSQAEDTYRGAERLIKEYGDVASGGMIRHVTMPDNFMSEMETTISQIVGSQTIRRSRSLWSMMRSREQQRHSAESRRNALMFSALQANPRKTQL